MRFLVFHCFILKHVRTYLDFGHKSKLHSIVVFEVNNPIVTAFEPVRIYS